MATWGEIVEVLKRPENRLADGRPNHDKVRREYLAGLFAITERPVIVYSTAWLDRETAQNVSISLGDIQGFMNACAGIRDRDLDLIINSPGGSPEAAESIVTYLRKRFHHIRVFVPVAAMSAATMMALGSDEIVMGAHSQLGPIDPQLTIPTPDGPRSAPAQAILDQFEVAKEQCRDQANLVAWLPILRYYGPGLLALCQDQRRLAESVVASWLEHHMFKDAADAGRKATETAAWFANYEYFGSHGRRVSLSDVQNLGLRATALESDQDLQDAVLSVHHIFSLTHANAGANKIIENHLGRAYVKSEAMIQIPVPTQPSGQPGRAPTEPNRAARRRVERGRK